MISPTLKSSLNSFFVHEISWYSITPSFLSCVSIIDENFSTDKVELGVEDGEKKGGMNLSNGLKMLNSMQSDPQFGKMSEMLNPGGEGGSPEDLLNKMKENMPEDLMKNFDKEMGNMPDMINKMMNMGNNDGETNEVVEELPDDQVENSLSLDELKEKFGIDIENDETRDAEPLLD